MNFAAITRDTVGEAQSAFDRHNTQESTTLQPRVKAQQGTQGMFTPRARLRAWIHLADLHGGLPDPVHAQ